MAIDTGLTALRHHHAALSLLIVPVGFATTCAFWLGLSLLLWLFLIARTAVASALLNAALRRRSARPA